jgi:hypothetical protein
VIDAPIRHLDTLSSFQTTTQPPTTATDNCSSSNPPLLSESQSFRYLAQPSACAFSFSSNLVCCCSQPRLVNLVSNWLAKTTLPVCASLIQLRSFHLIVYSLLPRQSHLLRPLLHCIILLSHSLRAYKPCNTSSVALVAYNHFCAYRGLA